MASNKEKGMSIMELVLTLGIITIIGSIISQYMLRSKAATQEIEAIEEGQQTIADIMQRLRRQMQTRDASEEIQVNSLSLTFRLPIDSTSSSSYSLTLMTKCRQLPNPDETIYLPEESNSQNCFQSFSCAPNELPYIEISATGHPHLPVTQLHLEEKAFLDRLRSSSSVAGYGLCFEKGVDTLQVKALAIHIKRNDHQTWNAKIKSELAQLSINKRNAIDLMP